MVPVWIIKYIAIPIVVLGTATFYRYVKFIPQDNIIEEAIEEVIKEKIGVDVDLSPESPEVKK